ncbi:hypothetical protein SAMN05421538_10846 [Paracoccus isoporae]|uniref:Uncharacterized protein n=1 Tax=Paracoccus isoporae TaxID=591205 RepID=A0A1G7E0R6_9RHOB|nr:hypothetical protein [Paracoccus isoporae]SDE57313.1 hypothetical protein SAMN05421538_10846 [Paracoccus isoporae]
MSDFETLGLKSGRWTGLLRRETGPNRVVLAQAGRIIADAEVTEDAPGLWRIEATLPVSSLSDGMQTFSLLGNAGDGKIPHPDCELLAEISVTSGQAAEIDLHAELALIRAELDMLKKEFRRISAP